MNSSNPYKAEYNNSYALIIGINSYKKCSPLSYAKQDAESIAETLEKYFKFPKENINLLIEKEATKEAIIGSYLKYAQDKKIKDDDRLLVFFAGHGVTKVSSRGDVGYLVPFDGDPDDINSLIRWDEFTRNADFIPAKHIFFLMDACYGGLAFLRQPSFGAMRFLKDTLRRRSRQVLTAGKADEPVADGNGVRKGHSIFTAHLLNALEGASATSDGIISASGVMSYVYEKVAGDQYSNQTPHYGFIDGDGDFIFDTSLVSKLVGPDDSDENQDTKEKDVLINTSQQTASIPSEDAPVIETMKELLSEPSKRIKLDDFLQRNVKVFLEKIDLRNFPVQGVNVTNEEFVERIKKYEEASINLQQISVLLTKWGNSEQLGLLEKLITRIAEADKGSSGSVLWLNLSWYPIQLIMYSAGITAIAEQKYDALKIILKTPIRLVPDVDGELLPINVRVATKLSEIHDNFKTISGHERHYAPRSEYLFKILQPMLEDLLFLGRSYESLFDRFELLSALSFADDYYKTGNTDAWGPIGRFGWKNRSPFKAENPVTELMEEAKKHKDDWKPLKSGFFNNSFSRFNEVFNAYKNRLDKLGWF